MGFLVLEAGASWRGSRERVGWGGGGGMASLA